MNLQPFKEFILLYYQVLNGIKRGSPQPFTDDPAMNAYDFRPKRPNRMPSHASLAEALRELSIRNTDRIDAGVFSYTALKRVQDNLGLKIAELELAHLVVAYCKYRKLRDGRSIKCKLLNAGEPSCPAQGTIMTL